MDDTITTDTNHTGPVTLPISIEHFETLVASGAFESNTGQTELIHGRMVHMNPQGPEHADPIDRLTEWSFEQVRRRFTIRVEKPIRLAEQMSSPEPDIVWATRQRYHKRHPNPDEVHLLIEVSQASARFDLTEKMELYAEAKTPEYWQVDVASHIVTVHRDPRGQTYGQVQTYDASQSIRPLCLPEASLAVAELFVLEQ